MASAFWHEIWPVVVDFDVVPQPKTIAAHCGSLVVKTRILSLPEKTLTLKKPRAHRDEHVGDLKRGHRGPTEASQKRTRRTRRSVTWTKGTFPAEMRPVPQTPAAPRTSGRLKRRIRDDSPVRRAESSTQGNSSSRSSRQQPGARIFNRDTTERLLIQRRERVKLVTTRFQPFLEDPGPPPLTTVMSSKADQRTGSDRGGLT